MTTPDAPPLPGSLTGAPPPDAEPQSSGLAATTLVCGLLGLVTGGVAGALALVTGLLALFDIQRSRGRKTGSVLAVAGMLVGACSIGLYTIFVFVFLIPFIHQSQIDSTIQEDVLTLQMIGTTLVGHAEMAEGKLPDDLRRVAVPTYGYGASYSSPFTTFGRAHDTQRRKKIEPDRERDKVLLRRGDYWFCFQGMKTDMNTKLIMGFTRWVAAENQPGRSVVDITGAAIWLSHEEFAAMIPEQNELRKEYDLPPIRLEWFDRP